eukprot:CAMPEP_0179084896 /NCGR_PEP_ID=MMETSP0796-20121207/38417_1 /TAXON_ID=73915 /ORGANISM="Pyrodinium bahamense, Strain pbaha01" /LENGTH=282 /DNA_ID=CAMNT_0020782323 /DNA_START=1 /DNA_END=849 /DNA_ORIENTATION=-
MAAPIVSALLPAAGWLALGQRAPGGLCAGRWRRPPLSGLHHARVAAGVARRAAGEPPLRPQAPDSAGSGFAGGSGVGRALLVAFLFFCAVAATASGFESRVAVTDDFVGCEGYWAPASVCLPLGTDRPKGHPTEENKDCPQWRMKNHWPGRESFLKRLEALEDAVKEADSEVGPQTVESLEEHDIEGVTWVNVYRYRGLAPSRVNASQFVGSAEFQEPSGETGMCWPDGYSWYYIKEYKVKPSKKFLKFVNSFDLNAFKNAVAALKPPEQVTDDPEESDLVP